MKYRVVILSLAFSALLTPQLHPGREPEDQIRLPNGRNQKEEILKADHAKTLEDVNELSKLVEDLKTELEKNDQHVLSVTSLKKIDNIEKLTKRIRSRLKRY
jgi:hypothetical protein